MYPLIEPYLTGTLKVSDIHTLYYEVSGNKDGNPVVFVHGGPGGGTDAADRSFFDPEKYKIILFDQRGAGKSTPSACLEENTTWDLVKDIEKVREELKIDKWHVFGGSWGSTLSLAYAQTFPDRVKSLVLRGIFTLRKRYAILKYALFMPVQLESSAANSNSSIKKGPRIFSPKLGKEQILGLRVIKDEYIAPIPEAERGDLMLAYHAQLNSADDETRINAARAWAKWEMATSRLFVDPAYLQRVEDDEFANAFARIENHYFVNEGFMRDGQLLEKQGIDKMQATTAYTLKKAFPEAELHIVPDAGHSSREPGIAKLLVEVRRNYQAYFCPRRSHTGQATNKFADL
ncbi:hypothetical protein C0995_007819 [Termitomyces sp. Mi166|nr:hypothetical protein C0995_007819 [Termitomyces sp. Mi166\